jgi:hypothetical protein
VIQDRKNGIAKHRQVALIREGVIKHYPLVWYGRIIPVEGTPIGSDIYGYAPRESSIKEGANLLYI